MGELQAAGHVADGVDPAVGDRAQILADGDAAAAELDPGRLQADSLDIGPAPGGDQQVAARQGLSALQRHLDGAGAAGDGGDLGAIADLDALGAQPLEGDGGNLRVLAAERRQRLQHDHPAAEAAVRLGQFDADRAAADDDQGFGQLAVVPQRLVGQVGGRVEPGDRRHRRRRAGGDDEAPGRDHMPAGSDFGRAGKAAMGLDHPHPQPLESLDRIMRRDGGDGAPHMVHDGAVVDLRLVRGDAERAGGAVPLGRPGGGDQRLGGHAAVVQAVAAHLVGLDQHHPGAQLRRPGGDRQPARPGADDAEIGRDAFSHVRLPPDCHPD